MHSLIFQPFNVKHSLNAFPFKKKKKPCAGIILRIEGTQMAIEDSGHWTEFSVISEGLKYAKFLPSVNLEARRKL